MSAQNPELNTQQNGGRNPLLLIGGFVVIVGALALLLFGGTLFGNNQAIEEQIVSADLPASAVVLPVSGDPLQVGDQPYEFALQDIQGNTIQLSELVGQPIIVNFWATWCGPCRIEMPELQAAFEKYQDQGLMILALDQDESAPEVQDYFAELGLTFTPLLDDDSDTAQNFGLQGTLPASVFINPDGEVTVIHRGVMTRGQLDSFLAETIPGKVAQS
jgi:cytochrome c biogenesis protein CcmG/thiol:disulfide interchange protein DsbE